MYIGAATKTVANSKFELPSIGASNYLQFGAGMRRVFDDGRSFYFKVDGRLLGRTGLSFSFGYSFL